MDDVTLSLIIPCYNVHSELLAWHREAWGEYPTGMEIILVDDCSSPSLWRYFVGETDGIPVPVLIPRVLVDIEWNQPGARNLGAHLAGGEWLLFCDAEHRFAPETIAELIAKKKNPQVVYYFTRKQIDPNGWKITVSVHLGTLLISAQLFKTSGGWDEDFCGHYGFDDLWFHRCHVDHAEYLPQSVDMKPYYASDAPRIAGVNATLYELKLAQRRAGIYQPGRQLRFPWKCLI